MKEIWKSVSGYDGFYEVSNRGRIKSLYHGKERILKAGIGGNGYCVVVLCKDKKKSSKVIHAIVAESFLNHKPCGFKRVIDHIDDNKLNNNAENLRIVSNRQNTTKNAKGEIKFVGVTKRGNKYRARMRIGGKLVSLGTFKCELAAAKAYQDRLKEIDYAV